MSRFPPPSRAPRVLARRDFLRYGAAGGAGLLLGGLDRLGGRPWPGRPEAKASAVIHLFLGGGLSHIDSFDPKPYAPVEVRGQFRAVRSKLDGEYLCQHLRRTAQIANKIAIIRSMTHGEADHDRGHHSMLTGYAPSPAITYPSLGSVVSHELGSRQHLPPYVGVPNANHPFLGPGYMSAAHAAFSIGGEPARRGFKVRDLSPQKGVDAARLARRRALVHDLNAHGAPLGEADALAATEAFYQQAYALIESKPAREAFNLKAEPKKMRDRYGRTGVGQRLLLARRLVAAGVRYVTVRDDGWDHHRNLFRIIPRRLQNLDRAFAALIGDLAAQGLLDSTLVVVSSEFGRTPQINRDRGRDHWPKVFSVVLAGGGIKAGVVHGASDAEARQPERDPVSPADLAATIFSQLGIDPEGRILSPGDRPIDIVRGGEPIEGILA